ncbi:glycosyltransferase [Pectobacterium cacticida]|uniref:glycosyltransferase n=1 Tax=Pectobacterium cacticida TaxID=69221 RepID=UPI002FF13797
MNVYLAALGSAGDVYPFILVGDHLVKSGHCVYLCANPFFKALAESRGMNFIGIGSAHEYQKTITSPELWHKRTALDTLCRYMLTQQETMYDQLVSRVDTADIMVTSLWSFAAKSLAEVKKCCVIPMRVGPSTFLSQDKLPQHAKLSWLNLLPRPLRKYLIRVYEKQVLDRRLASGVNAFRQKINLPPITRILTHWTHHSDDGLVCLFPDWFAPVQADWPHNATLVGFPLFKASTPSDNRNVPPDFFAQETVLFCPGWALQQDENLLRRIINEILRLRKQCLLVGVDPNALPQQDGVLVRKEVDLDYCLNACCAAIHHGGIGTVSLCFYHAVPQLIFPSAFDQFDNARRVEQLGCGITLTKRYSKAINQALERVINEGRIRERCRWAQEKYGEKNHCMESIRTTLEQAHHQHQLTIDPIATA